MNRGAVLRRRAVGVALILLALFAGYMLWFRNSSLFSVDQIEVKGVTANRSQIAAALATAARDMTTLHVRADQLQHAVAPFPTVATVGAHATLFHKLEITVTERLPVAKAKIEGETVPISADGYVLRGLDFDRSALPSIDAGPPGPGARLDEDGAAQAAIVGAVPGPLRDRLRGASWDESLGGVVVDLRGAPELRFGGGGAAEAKWRAVSALLAQPGGVSVAYIDVSVPSRPVTG